MKLKTKPYRLWDYIAISLRCAPVVTTLMLLRRFLVGVTPALKILTTALFVDTALAIFAGDAESGAIFRPLLYILLLLIWGQLTDVLGDMLQIRAAARRAELFRVAVFDKRARLEYKHIEDNETWELLNRTCTAPDAWLGDGFSYMAEACTIIISMLSLLSVIMTEVWWAGLAIIGFWAPLFYFMYRAGQKTYEADKEAKKHTRRADYLMGVITGRENAEERSLFDYTGNLDKQWYEKYESARKINQKVRTEHLLKSKGGTLLSLVFSTGFIAILVFPLGTGDLTIGMFAGLATAILHLVGTLSWQLSWLIREVITCSEFMKDLTKFTTLSEREGAVDIPASMKDFRLESIEFRDVSFAYPGTERLILKGFNLTIEAGRHYAFVGANGAGKTTITKLLCGLYDNYTGEIYVNGKNLKEYTLAELKSLFSVVYQDFARYYIPLRDSVALGDVSELGGEDSRLTDILQTVELTERVEKLPHGADTYLGRIKSGGVDLSGGEWQRIAIARSLFSKTVLRILDEPTAALDPVAESNVYKMFGEISRGQTTLFITHRLGAARLADVIVVIDEGRAAETGSHETLMEQNGLYAEMFNAQRSWYQ